METFQQFVTVFPDFFIRSVAALFCGGIIGLERERKGKPAGLRTNILICLGSTLYMLIAEFILFKITGTPGDPSRIAAQVVTGIGFIGAGTIIQSRGQITGLTSAAVIYTVAAIGLCIGAGFPLIALYFTTLVVFVLNVLSRYENRLLGKCHFVNCTIKLKDKDGKIWAELSEVLREYDVTTSDYSIKQTKGHIVLDMRYCDKHPAHSRFLYDIWKISGTEEVRTDKTSPLLQE